MANPEVKKLRERTEQYLNEHPRYRNKTPKATKRKVMRTWKKLTGDDYCFYCGKKLTRHNATIDHIIPLSRGGTNDKRNLVLCCQKCNWDKGSKLLSEWMEEKK